MPLYPKDGKLFMDDSFDNAVIGGLDDPKFPPGPVDGLMMGAVGDHGFSIEFSKKRIFPHGGGVQLVAVFPCVSGRFFDVLGNRSSKIDVDDLHSFANSKNRFFRFVKDIQRLKLDDIQFDVDISGAVVFLPEKCRSDIPAAGKQEGIHIGELSKVHSRQMADIHSV